MLENRYLILTIPEELPPFNTVEERVGNFKRVTLDLKALSEILMYLRKSHSRDRIVKAYLGSAYFHALGQGFEFLKKALKFPGTVCGVEVVFTPRLDYHYIVLEGEE